MTNSWATGWATNDVVPASEFAKGMGSISDTTLGVATASFDITGIVAVYAHLRLVLMGRSDTAAVETSVGLRFNNDSSAIYDTQAMDANNATQSDSESKAATSITCGIISAASGVAGMPGMIVIDIPAYALTTFNKLVFANGFNIYNTTSATQNIRVRAGQWRSTAAINRITLTPGAGNFAAGTKLTIYAMGA